MKEWHTDTIIVAGLVAGLLLIIIAVDIISIMQGDLKIIDLGKEMIVGLLGFIGGGATQALKHKNENGGESK